MWRILGPLAILIVVLVPGYLLPPFAQIALGGAAFLVALPLFGAIAWSDLAGFTDSDGPMAFVPTGADAELRAIAAARIGSANGPVRIVLSPDSSPDATLPDALAAERLNSYSVRSLRGSLIGASACRIVGDGSASRCRIALAARLAGCVSVTAEPDPGSGGTRGRFIQRRLWGALADSEGRDA